MSDSTTDTTASTPTEAPQPAQQDPQPRAAHERRRILVVNKPLQSRIILAISWPSTIGLVLTALILASLCKSLIDEARAMDVELSSVVPLMVTVIVFLFASTGFLIFNGLKISHRVAGPLYRFRKTLEAVKEGDRDVRIRLREGDFLQDHAEDLNEFLDWLATRSLEPLPADRQTSQRTSTPQGTVGESADETPTAVSTVSDDGTTTGTATTTASAASDR